ncbi:MAG TPA: cobyric acid synthase [Candidatus Limnocylindrales bacterium]|nr:cobyric acid synthase [Candidatus Limnocylindrales bacterium]
MSARAKVLMLQGTGSHVGKSILVTALCRIFKQEGYRVAPFKAQNMALNSFVTKDGGEMGRAQVVQAQACGIEPEVDMNPILLKPTTDYGSQVIVLGKPVGTLPVEGYWRYKETLREVVRSSLERLRSQYDLILIEGAGSPAEINLRSHDIVNMSVAHLADAPVLLVGDIDRGGVFAWLVGTLELLAPEDRERIRGFIINKFRGRKEILKPGLDFLESKTGRPVLGVVPFFKDFKIPDEDSVSLYETKPQTQKNPDLQIEVVQFPRISNFTDFDPLKSEPDVQLRYIQRGSESLKPDLLILPGTKNTIADLLYLKSHGFVEALQACLRRGGMILGICGGYQMLGKRIYDPEHVEGSETQADGLGFLNTVTTLLSPKITRQVNAVHRKTGIQISGYEIHMGRTEVLEPYEPVFEVYEPTEPSAPLSSHPRQTWGDGLQNSEQTVWGTYIHGLFDNDLFRRTFLDQLREKKGLKPLKEVQYVFDLDQELDRLAELVKKNLDMTQIYRLLKL